MSLVEIPLAPAQAQSFSAVLGARTYRMRLQYIDIKEGGWILDIGDAAGVPLVCGLPLLPGQDLLAQHDYLGLGGALYVDCTGEPDFEPTFEGLGTRTRLFFGPPQPPEVVYRMAGVA